MSTVDLPPGIGLVGTPLGTFRAPARARRLATISLLTVSVLAPITWYFASRQWSRKDMSAQLVLPMALVAMSGLGFLVRRARVAVTRDGVRWGWDALHFTQERARIVTAHVYSDGVAFEARRGSWWFIAARDWDRFDAFVRQLRRAELPITEHAGRAPFRARRQSYGRFLDALLVLSMIAAVAVMLWTA